MTITQEHCYFCGEPGEFGISDAFFTASENAE